ncbi:MAG: multiheme c-type cytochrome [Bryobacteraceae bacterium]
MARTKAAIATCTLALLPVLLPAQEIDTVLFEKDRKSFRLIDQIERPAERRALESLFTTRDPAQRLSRAESFLESYPASAFLSVVYDVAARSCLDLKRPECALRYASQSLRLLPENPLLLVSLAELQAAGGLKQQAASSARQALDYLDRYARPSGFTEAQWAALEPKLRRTADSTLMATGTPPRRVPALPQEAAEYAGSQACRSCHSREYAAWQFTGMARMFAPYRAANVFGRFDGAVREGLIRPVEEDGRHLFEVKDSEGKWERQPVHFTIGSKWQQAYATQLESGRIHVFPIQYNRLTGQWFNYWKKIDSPTAIRGDVARFLEFSEATSYQRNCAPCHTSQLQLHGSADVPDAIGFAEPGVNCEMCHGPSARHARAMASGTQFDQPASSPPVRFRNLDAQTYIQICAQCHRQSAMFERGPRGEMNYSGSSPHFFSKAKSRPLIEFSRKAFYRDGRFRETTFIVEAFERTKCFRLGGAHCGHCHNPHPRDFPANLKALKFPDHPDRMCTQCHGQLGRQILAHTRHQPGSEGASCIACHMPKIANSLEFRARTHTIDDIPDASMTQRFGLEESPNACLDCHPDRDVAWVAGRLRDWYP